MTCVTGHNRKRKGKAIPPVDVALFERAFAAFREAICNDASEDREIGSRD